jgi:peptide/nickel transport system permease protein
VINTVFPVNITIQYYRGTEPDPIFVDKQRFSYEYIGDTWFSQTGTTLEVSDLLQQIFTKAGNYTAEFVISIEDLGETADYTLYIDNFQVIHYGKAFGLLGTASVPKGTPRDLFTMLIYGTRISFMIGILTAVFSVLIGLFIGLVAGYVRGLVDEGLMRFADFLLVLPGLPLLIVLVLVLGRSIWNIIGVLIFMGWMGFSRTVRSMVLSLRERPFIESAKASGGGTGYIIYRHILPNVFALVYISLATSVPGAIISEASLAWLGLGDINIPSWGIMLFDFSSTQTAIVRGLGEYWFWVIPPGVAIALLAMAFILMGFSLDEILNPKLRKRR